MRRAALLLLVLALGSGCGEASPPRPAPQAPAEGASEGAEPTTDQLLREITEAERTHVYSGYKTAYHGVEGEGRRTRMQVSRLADGRMVLAWERDGHMARRWVVRHRHRWIDDPSLLLRNYEVVPVTGEAEPVAGRPTFRVEIRPRHPGRPSLTLLVDPETRLVLAERLRDHDGVQRFAWSFDSIDYAPRDLDVDEAEVVAAPDRIEVVPSGLDWPTLSIGTPPAGFVKVACLPGEGAPGAEPEDVSSFVEYWSDGLAAFALRQRPTDDLAGVAEGRLERRECSGRASVTGVVGGVEITLLGNLPIDELEAVAADLRLRP